MSFFKPLWRRQWVRISLYAAAGIVLLLWLGSLIIERTVCRGGSWDGPVTDHFVGKKFFNPEADDEPHNGSYFWWGLTRTPAPYVRADKNADQPDLAEEIHLGEWEATLVNHSTFLIRVHGVNILTDPVWSERTSPVTFAGPVRYRPAGIEWDKLPKVDVVLITHDHYDHLDLETIRKLNERFLPQFYVPLGNRQLLESIGIRSIVEMDWWEEATYAAEKGTVKITMTPARHFSARYRTESARNKTLWAGYYLEGADGVKLYFTGDSAWTGFFEEIRKKLGSPDVAFLPIGAYKPENLIARAHMTPSQAVRAFQTLKPGQGIAMHFGTWQLADDGYAETLSDFHKALDEQGVSPESFVAPDNGRTFRGKIKEFNQ